MYSNCLHYERYAQEWERQRASDRMKHDNDIRSGTSFCLTKRIVYNVWDQRKRDEKVVRVDGDNYYGLNRKR